MPQRTRRKPSPADQQRVSWTDRLPRSKLSAAKKARGAATASDTIERALDLVVFERALIDGTRSMQGTELSSSDLGR